MTIYRRDACSRPEPINLADFAYPPCNNPCGEPAEPVAPSAPLNLSLLAGDTEIDVSWDVPASTGGSPITDYIVEYSADGGQNWSIFADGTSTDTSATITSLNNDTEYTIRVSAVNAVGTGSPSATQTATPVAPTAPDAPTNLLLTVGDSEIEAAWDAPLDDGGSPITDYIIEYSDDGGSSWSTFADGTGIGTTATITGLTNGTEYTVRVSAVNAIGTGVASSTATATPVAGTDVFLLAGQSNATARAAFDGGADYPTDGTVLQWGRNGADDGVLINAARPLQHNSQAGGVDTGFALQFVLDYRAANPTRNIVLIPAASGATSFDGDDWNPGDPRYQDAVDRTNACLAANPDFEFAGILWHQGESDALANASAQYQARLDAALAGFRADITGATATTPIVLGGLVPDFIAAGTEQAAVQAIIEATPGRVEYTGYASSTGLDDNGDNLHFDMASFRTLGSRYYTAFAAVTAWTVPGQVTGLSLTAGDQEIEATWVAPASDGGTPITDYVIETSTDGGTNWSTVADGVSTATSYTITGLTNGTTYTVRVSAANTVGAGVPSSTSAATPVAAVPGAEVGAAGHWLLGASPQTLAGGSLSLVGSAPTANTGFESWSDTQLRGYDTGIADTSTISYWGVFRIPSFAANGIVMGNSDLSAGRIMFIHNSGTFRLRTDSPGDNVYDVEANFPSNVWTFVGFSFDGVNFEYYRGDAVSPVSVSLTVDPGIIKDNIGIANIGLNVSAVNNALDFAEAGVFLSAKSAVDWADIYGRSVARMSARGITVV